MLICVFQIESSYPPFYFAYGPNNSQASGAKFGSLDVWILDGVLPAFGATPKENGAVGVHVRVSWWSTATGATDHF